jgi:hypothetical protein
MTEAVDKKRAVLAKIESSYGVDPTPAGATDAVLCRITGWRPQEVIYASRADIAIPALGRFASKTAYQRAEIDLEIEVSGAAAAGTAPPYGPILRACGLSETIVAVTSVTYNPISAAHESVAMYVNIDGMQQKLLGMKGSVALVFRNEEIPFYRFRGMALYAIPTDTALPSLTLTAHQAPVPVNRTNTTTASLHGYSFGLQELEIDLGCDVQYLSLPAGGSNKVLIANREPTGRVVIEHPTIAQKDFHTLVTSGATGSLSVAHTGGGAGKVLTLTAAQARLTNPQVGAVKGIRTLSLGLELAPSVALNNELSIAYT